jgi:dTDP-4-dehydrorhamnose reductase
MLFGWSKNKLNLATLLISKLSKGEKIDVINDQIVSPSFNDNVAEILLELADKKLSGIYHVSGSDVMSRLEFAKALAKEFKLDENLLESIPISDFNWKSCRPKNGGLDVGKIIKILDKKPMSVLESLKQMKRNSNGKMYV